MKNNFFICIETLHCADGGIQENAHELPPEKLKQRDVVFIDIANDNILNKVRITTVITVFHIVLYAPTNRYNYFGCTTSHLHIFEF